MKQHTVAFAIMLSVVLISCAGCRGWREDRARRREIERITSTPLVATNGVTFCALHSVALMPGLVPLRREFRKSYKSRSQLFPQAYEFYQGSVCGLFTQPTNALVLFCPECRRALVDYIETNAIEEHHRTTGRTVLPKADASGGQ